MIKNRMLITSLVTAVMLFASACGSSGSAGSTNGKTEQTNANTNGNANSGSYQTQNFSFSSGQPDGVLYPSAVTITSLMKKHMGYKGDMNIFPGGGTSNVINVHTGKAEFGFSYSSATVAALKGEEPFGEPQNNVRHAATLFPFVAQWVTLPNSGINSIDDLKGKKVNLGTKGQASRLVANDILEAYGIKESDLGKVESLGFGDGLQQLKDGHLDAIFWQQDAPYGPFSDLASTKGLKLLALDQDKFEIMQKKNPGYLKGVIKAGTYKGVTEDVLTVSTPLSLLVNKDQDEQLVYDLVKTMSENFTEFQESLPPMKVMKDAQEMSIDIGVELHPGAKKYYQEKGWVK